jgi:hypothetical protein
MLEAQISLKLKKRMGSLCIKQKGSGKLLQAEVGERVEVYHHTTYFQGDQLQMLTLLPRLLI